MRLRYTGVPVNALVFFMSNKTWRIKIFFHQINNMKLVEGLIAKYSGFEFINK